jgi:hypothetical protein
MAVSWKPLRKKTSLHGLFFIRSNN